MAKARDKFIQDNQDLLDLSTLGTHQQYLQHRLENAFCAGYDAVLPQLTTAQEKVKGLEDMLVLQQDAGNWANETFGKSQTVDGVVNHLAKEVLELSQSDAPDEAADCLLLLMQHAHECGYDLLEEGRKKHEINLKRKWGKPDENGVIEHIRNP